MSVALRAFICGGAILAGVAALHPYEERVADHPQVIFAEDFERTTLDDVFARWGDVRNGSAMTLTSDVHASSRGSTSLAISWDSRRGNTGGHLYKQLPSAINDTVHVRYYVKYPAGGGYRHTGVWIGGYNPPVSWPVPEAGVKPRGDDRFIAAAEQNTLTSRFDHYNYWVDMRRAVDGHYWGNLLLNNPDVQAKENDWTCVEHMVKLNNPVTEPNGEHAIWIDGVKVSHVGSGFPAGVWRGGAFTQGAGELFEGIRWRSDRRLHVNWIWLQTYAPAESHDSAGTIRFDDVIAATRYIGCLDTPFAQEAR